MQIQIENDIVVPMYQVRDFVRVHDHRKPFYDQIGIIQYDTYYDKDRVYLLQFPGKHKYEYFTVECFEPAGYSLEVFNQLKAEYTDKKMYELLLGEEQ